MPTVDMYTIITIDICIVSILPLIKIFRLNLEMFRQCGIFVLITPYIRILDCDWLIAGVFSYLGLISFIFTAAGVFSRGFNFSSPLCRGICENVFHFFTLACFKPPNSFGIFLLYLYT
jgi:hypothetical protein